MPAFDELTTWGKEQMTKLITLQSPIGKAFAYLSEREKQLSVFLDDGMLLMDMNLIKNSIRPIALGGNNYFAGSHDAAQNAAIMLLAARHLQAARGERLSLAQIRADRHAKLRFQPDQRTATAALDSWRNAAIVTNNIKKRLYTCWSNPGAYSLFKPIF